MRRFEMLIVQSETREPRQQLVADLQLTYGIPDEAQELLVPILGRYDQDPMFYFDRLNYGSLPAPWALACLDKEYQIAGHVSSSRVPNAGISFAPYNQVPSPIPDDFVPGVGVLVFMSKSGLQSCADSSPLFKAAWKALEGCQSERRWLVILDPLSGQWLEEVLPGDRELWVSTRAR
jgi:hypothetical protein